MLEVGERLFQKFRMTLEAPVAAHHKHFGHASRPHDDILVASDNLVAVDVLVAADILVAAAVSVFRSELDQ